MVAVINERNLVLRYDGFIVTVIFINLTVVLFVRNSLSVAIVAMVNSTSDNSDYDSKDVCPAAINKSESSDSD
ncbi:hypothetical protein Anas_09943, partial [Armadillidium nasatum]